MEYRHELLKRDDWELLGKELRGQRVQLLLQLSVVEAGLRYCEAQVKVAPIGVPVESTK